MACVIAASYIEAPQFRSKPLIPVAADSFPVIDLSPMLLEKDCREPKAMEKLVNQVRRALKEWGAFHVINHGVPLQVIPNMRAKLAYRICLPPLSFLSISLGISLGVINILQVFTNDRIESVVHKVMVGGEERYSVVLAIEPTRNAIIEPLEEFVNEENPPKYKAFMWEKLSTSRKLSEFVKSDVKTLGA
ncbi:uncharacterized protein LOC18447945 [Amborella trichopoda]|nr:uncharacterized protein LOC18447945 [Amborella trichopoda]|eukprot:XP_020531538.1 uncharacterized protein LOC18447945 [Amborella trichopoda]